MKRCITLSLTLAFYSQISFSNDKDFEKYKENNIKNLDERISMFQKKKECIVKSKNKEEMRQCHKSMNNSKHNFREKLMFNKKINQEKKK